MNSMKRIIVSSVLVLSILLSSVSAMNANATENKKDCQENRELLIERTLDKYYAQCQIADNDKKHNFYSSKWGNNTWLKKNGVNGYIHSVVNYDVTEDIDYKYKGIRKVRHHESF